MMSIYCPDVKNYLGEVNEVINIADNDLKAIFLADSSCRVSLLGRSCFYAPNPSYPNHNTGHNMNRCVEINFTSRW
jgi:hypothetical protein